jgi:hypothetical protein
LSKMFISTKPSVRISHAWERSSSVVTKGNRSRTSLT